MGVARRHRGSHVARRLSHGDDRLPARAGRADHRWSDQGLPQHLPASGLTRAVGGDGSLQGVDDMPVPQLVVRPRRSADRHPRPPADVPGRHPDGGLRPRADPHRGGVGQARVRLPVAPCAVVPRVDRSTGRALRQLPVRHVHPVHPPAGPDVPHQLEGVRRELQRRLPRPLRPSPAQRSAPLTGHRGALRRAHVQRLQAAPGDLRHERWAHGPRGGGAAGPLRRLHLPQPDATAVRHDADPRAGRSAGAGPDPAGVADLRRREVSGGTGGGSCQPGGHECGGHGHGDTADGQPALPVLPGRSADAVGGDGRRTSCASFREDVATPLAADEFEVVES